MRAPARLVLAATLLASAGSFAADDPALIAGGELESVLPLTETADAVPIDAFRLDRRPVTNGEFLAFVEREPRWRRDAVPALFAGPGYLGHWEGPVTLGASALAGQPVTNVSWFSARAYCESAGGRLPTWHEWEYVAAADETRKDARSNPVWRQQLLAQSMQDGGKPLPPVGRGAPNAWSVWDMHGLVWEWVDDFNALMASRDNREQGGGSQLKFCGAGAAVMQQKENYTVLMRTALLSGLTGRDLTRSLGFRCAYDLGSES